MSHPLTWIPAAHGHELALDGTTLRCRKSNGQILKSVPRTARYSTVGEELSELRERLVRHESTCRATVDSWLLAGVPIPSALLARVWPDPAWRCCLEHLVVTVEGQTGLLADVTEAGRTTLTGLDGATFTASPGPVTLPHPVHLLDADRWRKVLESQDAAQGIPQLTRQTHRRPAEAQPEATSVDDYAGGRFERLQEATARAAEHGFAVRGGSAVLDVADDGVRVQARYWVGADDPKEPTTTGRLVWVDAAERPLTLAEVGPVAWSEGVRMAALIHEGRQPDEQQ